MPTPKPPDSGLARNRILLAARDEFATRGLNAASVHTIAKQAGVTAAMINYYFGGKRALYDTVVAEALERLMARIAEAIHAPGKVGVPSRLAAAYFDFLAEEGQLQRLLLRQVLDRDDTVAELTAPFVRPLRRLLEKHFGGDEASVQYAISLFGAIAGYFIYQPVLGAFVGKNPLSPRRLAVRRAHVIQLAATLERMKP